MQLDKLDLAIYGHFESVNGYGRMDRETGITKIIVFSTEVGPATLKYFLEELTNFVAAVDREIENETR